MNILITGIHGITGRYLAQLLAPKHQIFGADPTEEPVDGVVRVFTYSQFGEIPPLDAVIHLAGKNDDTVNPEEALKYIDSNVGLTQCIFEWFRNSSAKQFYYLSSLRVIGDRDPDCVLTEDFEPNPFGPLGESKRMAEQYLLEKWLLDKKVYILRCGEFHGKGLFFNYNSERVFAFLMAGWPYILGRFECRRSVTGVENLGFVLGEMLERDIQGGIYHVVDDGTMRASEMFWSMGKFMGKKIRIWYWNKRIFWLIAEIGEWMHSYFNRYEYRKLTLNFVSDNRKIKEALGIKMMPVPLNEGIHNSCLEYYQKKKDHE